MTCIITIINLLLLINAMKNISLQEVQNRKKFRLYAKSRQWQNR